MTSRETQSDHWHACKETRTRANRTSHDCHAARSPHLVTTSDPPRTLGHLSDLLTVIH